MWEWMHGDGWGFGMWGMGIVWIAVLALLVVVVVRLMGERSPTREPPFREDTPLEILKRRYARGDIDRDEFERRRRDLE